MTTIVILCINNALPSGLMGINDLLALSGLHFVQKSEDKALSKIEWNPKVIFANQDGRSITDGHGRIFEVDSDLDSIRHCDAVLVPGFIPNEQGHPPLAMTDSKTQSWLRTHYEQGTLMCGSCSGVFVLGEAGILNNRRCTTTWWLHDELKQRFPKTNAVWASGLIDDNGIITAGGPLSWVNITLHIVKRLAGTETAEVVADFSVVDAIPKSQNLYVPEGYQASKSPFLAKAEYAVRKAHYQTMSAPDLAKVMAISERTLNRKLKDLTGETPKAFIDGIRVSHACTLLLTTNKSVKEIAFSLGYSDDGVFRRLFKQKMKMAPSVYQQQRNNH
ncbi:GlxA family transcriptional regulator [Marinomonas transparens]|uniref:Helix-turn-helix domain-containing protein n=1 Tax=Marinomonas transparens TaxID=2795388 RepID=A0A934N120_9GAMM|nr:helix-turn-helix domain-containing protein [Marinomonas transparens]MBJ7537307.1 helix-turn-helix domain-containing protein [Marinomonas transparens]